MSSNFVLLVGVMFLVLFAWFPIWLLITLITPRRLLDKYLKDPHFNSGELIFFSSFPGNLYRTVLFCRLFLTPKAVGGRSLQGFVEDSPKWYKTSVIITVLGFMAHGVFVFASGVAILLWR